MRTGIFLNYADGFLDAVNEVVELERLGVDIALVAEAYPDDAISQLGFLAAKTSRIELVSGVVPIYIRTTTSPAMTAAGLDYVSDGRFRLGIGTSGPQVMEGFHGVPFDAHWAAPARSSRSAGRCGVVSAFSSTASTTNSAARRQGHWPGQAAASDQSPSPRTYSDHHCRAGSEERRTHRRDRRRLAAGVFNRKKPTTCGARRYVRALRSVTRGSVRWTSW